MEEGQLSAQERVVELLNNVAFQASDKERTSMLAKVQELIIHHSPHLLKNFCEEVLSFQTDKNANVRKFVAGFIGEACLKDHSLLPRLAPTMEMLLLDEALVVVKRVIQASNQILRACLEWLSSAKVVTELMDRTWQIISRMKSTIILMIDHENEGVRTNTIKFLESLILLQTYPESDSVLREGEFNLDKVPLTLKIARPRKLEEEAKTVFNKLIEFQESLHITSVGLMTCMSSLVLLAKARPQFLGKVVDSLEIINVNLPPTLTTSQVANVKKHMKTQLIGLLRHTAAYDYLSNISAILTGMGVTTSEINKVLPSKDELRKGVKRVRPSSTVVQSSKKQRPEPKEKDQDGISRLMQDGISEESAHAIEATQKWLVKKLAIEAVADLVMTSMMNLPEKLPPMFTVTYQPVTMAGSPAQIQHVARLLAMQLNASSINLGTEDKPPRDKKQVIEDKGKLGTEQKEVSNSSEEPRAVEPRSVGLVPAGMIPRPHWQKVKNVKLGDITKQLTSSENGRLQLFLLKRLVNCNKLKLYGEAFRIRHRILSNFCAIATPEEIVEIEELISNDLAGNIELLQSWLYLQFSQQLDFSQMLKIIYTGSKNLEGRTYEDVVIHLVKMIMSLPPNKDRDGFLGKLICEAPSIPEGVVVELMECGSQGVSTVGNVSGILYDIATWRGAVGTAAVSTLAILASHEQEEVRDRVTPYILKLLAKASQRKTLFSLVSSQLKYLLKLKPSALFCNRNLGRPVVPDDWTEETIKACLYLTLALVPHAADLMHELADVYVKTVNDAKRTILRMLETPISQVGMDTPALLSLVENCPKGSETLITRIVHILTEKAPPSEALVCRVRELYNNRVSDVRFLIPVLTGLSKKEVIAVLPKLIKLNPQVVKEVFNRLLGVTLDTGSSNVTPVDLMVALHLIGPDKCDVKTVIKATGLCLTEKCIYTSEVMAMVLQKLLEQDPLPTLFMRTVIQTLAYHPKLLSFIVNILQKLITMKVWTLPKVWEGFIKCCQRAVPQSFTVLLQLQSEQLADVFKEAPDLKMKISQHIGTLSDSQREHIPSALMTVIGEIRLAPPLPPPADSVDLTKPPPDTLLTMYPPESAVNAS